MIAGQKMACLILSQGHVAYMRALITIAVAISLHAAFTPALTLTAEGGEATAAKLEVRQQLASDTVRTTAAGATFVAPAGWWIETRGNTIILTPEGDSRLALVDVEEKDADAAVKSAWMALTPNFKWGLKVSLDAPGREGWDSFRNY